jgi:hypothetical protein
VHQVGAAGYEGLQAGGALFLEALGDQLDPDGKISLNELARSVGVAAF